MGSLTLSKLLIIDFTNENLKPGTSEWTATCNDVRVALENHGCFVALYDGVPSKLRESVFQAADQLFDLPTETKMKNIVEKPYHGYIGQIPVVPLHEGLGIDYATEIEGVESFTNIMWPTGNPFFSETSMMYSRAVAKLDHMVVRMLFESYGAENHITSHLESATYLLRYMKYRAPEENESTLAFLSHTDKSFLTILHQNQVSGLEIKGRDENWISVEFPSSSFVVMAGDACKAWSNDRVLSPNHRVVLDKQAKQTRYTLGLFEFLNGKVQVPDELVDNEHPLKFNPFNHVDLLHFYKTEIGRKSENILKDFCGVV